MLVVLSLPIFAPSGNVWFEFGPGVSAMYRFAIPDSDVARTSAVVPWCRGA